MRKGTFLDFCKFCFAPHVFRIRCLWSTICRFLTPQQGFIIPKWAWGCRDCVGAGIVADLTEVRSTSAVILGHVRDKSMHWATVWKWSCRREVLLWHRLMAIHLLRAKLVAFAVRMEWWCARCNSLRGFCIPWSCINSSSWLHSKCSSADLRKIWC